MGFILGVFFEEMIKRDEFFIWVEEERNRQQTLWRNDFDNLNTVNDWATFITRYANYATTGERSFHDAMVKVAAIALAAVETYDRNGGLAPCHYEINEKFQG